MAKANANKFYQYSAELVDAVNSGDVNRVIDAYLGAYTKWDPSRPMEHPCHGRLLQTRRWLESRGYSVRLANTSNGVQIAVTDNRTGWTWYSSYNHVPQMIQRQREWFDEDYRRQAARLNDPVQRLLDRVDDRLERWEQRAEDAVERINNRSNAGGMLADLVKTAIFGSPRY